MKGNWMVECLIDEGYESDIYEIGLTEQEAKETARRLNAQVHEKELNSDREIDIEYFAVRLKGEWKTDNITGKLEKPPSYRVSKA